MKNQNKEILVVSILVIFTAVWRIFSSKLGIYNIVPVAALGLFSGSVLNQKQWAYLIPLATMLVSDLMFAAFTNTPGFYGVSQLINYVALGLVTLLGTQLKNRSAVNILGYTLGGSMIFFLLSNFGTFLSGYYGYNFGGFTTCYAMAIPFMKSEMATQFFVNSFIGDLLFSFLAFGIFNMAFAKKPVVALS